VRSSSDSARQQWLKLLSEKTLEAMKYYHEGHTLARPPWCTSALSALPLPVCHSIKTIDVMLPNSIALGTVGQFNAW